MTRAVVFLAAAAVDDDDEEEEEEEACWDRRMEEESSREKTRMLNCSVDARENVWVWAREQCCKGRLAVYDDVTYVYDDVTYVHGRESSVVREDWQCMMM